MRTKDATNYKTTKPCINVAFYFDVLGARGFYFKVEFFSDCNKGREKTFISFLHLVMTNFISSSRAHGTQFDFLSSNRLKLSPSDLNSHLVSSVGRALVC